MSTLARYWAALAAIAGLLYACTGRSTAPLPFAPASGERPLLSQSASETPDFTRCPKAQRGWVFNGACKRIPVRRAGNAASLPKYSGFTLRLVLPRNDARGGQRVLLVDAIAADISRTFKGKTFPLYSEAVLYAKTENPARKIRFATGQTASFVIAGDGPFGSCNAARLSAGKWIDLGAGKSSGSTVSFAIPFAHYHALLKEPAYFAFACETAPTPSPTIAPTASPTTSPTSSPVAAPAYCKGFAAATNSPVPINIIDNSGLGGTLVMYAYGPNKSATAYWMSSDGKFDSTAPVPLPLPCYPGSAGGTGLQFSVPGNRNNMHLFITYATQTPSPSQQTAPNPIPNIPPGGPPPTLVGWKTAWFVPNDLVELSTSPGGIDDLTAVNYLGLPLEMWQGHSLRKADVRGARIAAQPARFSSHALPAPCPTSSPGIVGVTSCNFALIFQQMGRVAQYKHLVGTGTFGGRTIDLRIVNPEKSAGNYWKFSGDQFYNPKDFATPDPAVCPGAATSTAGYLACVMTSYQATPRLYANLNLSGALGATTDSYCASSDGTNFYFTDITKLGQSTCSGISPSSADTFEMPAQLFEEGTASAADGGGCQVAILFGLPFGNSWIDAGSTGGHLFKNGDAFALWKSLAVELDRGTALSTGTHIVGGWPQNPPPAPFSDYYNDPLFNEYAYILHYYYDQHRVYALAYDEPGDQFAGFGYNAGDSLYIRVNAVPAASGAAAPTTPEPSPTPPACAPLPTDVGL